MKIILIGVVVLVVIGGLLGAGLWLKGSNSNVDTTMTVRVENASRGDLLEIVQAPAEVQPRTKVSISARVAARIIELPFNEGDRVKVGDVLIRLDSRDLEAALRSAQARHDGQNAGIQVEEAHFKAQEAQIEGLKATLTEAARDLERQKGLLASHDVSQSVVDTAEQHMQEQTSSLDSAKFNLTAEKSNLEVLKHNLDAAEADIEQARQNLGYTTITSPIDGIVTTINAKVGELVVTGTMNNAGTVILEVADLSEMLAEARVDETDVASVEVNQPVKVHILAYPDEVFTGKVTTVALTRSTDRTGSGGGGSNGNAKTFKVDVMINTRGKRVPSGLTADVEIQTKENKNILRVPTQAVLGRPMDSLPPAVRDNNSNLDASKTVAMVVFKIVGGKAMMTPVVVGTADNNFTMIKSGLSDGDRIVTGPYKALEQLSHEQVVKEEKAATTAPAIAKAPSSQPASNRS